MVLSNAEKQARWRERTTALADIGRAQLAGRPANLFVRSCVADCISRPEDIAERQWGKDVALLTKAVRHRQRPGPGGMSEIYYGPKFGRGGGEKMLKILDF